jgi:hypothetical protein
MAIEELDDISEDMADKLGIYGEERSIWVSEFTRRTREALRIEQLLRANEDKR